MTAKNFVQFSLMTAAMLFICAAANAQQGFPGFPKNEVVEIWPGGAPNSNGDTSAEAPTAKMTIYKAQKPNGQAILCLPGGGYAMLSKTHEGADMASWFNTQGITFVLLEYRLPKGHKDVPLSDAQQAMRILRGRSAELGFTKLGVLGCSAGGHLASTVSTHFTDAATRPDFQILFYPVITMDKSLTHMSSHDLLLGEKASEADEILFSSEKQVTRDTPPAFIMHSTDDRLVNVENSLLYYKALVAHGVSATMHIYPVGGHGWGFGDRFPYKHEWTGELERWLREEVGSRK